MIGRYVEKDLMGLKGGVNLYRYVGNNPLFWSDPLGLFQYHGFYCGPNWTAGMPVSWEQMSEYDQKNAIKPRDPMDACCKTHDEGYGNCREKCKGLCGEKNEQCENECFNERDRQINQCLGNADLANIGDATKKLGAEIIFILQPAVRNGGYNGDSYYQLQFRF